MNKWRLLLSVLSLLQSVSAEHSFVDGRDRYHSGTRLSIGDPYRIHKPIHEIRHLNVPKDLVYHVRDAELTRAPAIRHLKHRELHGQSPTIQNTEVIPTDHRRTLVADRLGVNPQSDRRRVTQRSNVNEATRIDVRRSQIVQQNGDRDYADKSRPSIRDDSKENRVIRLHIVESRHDDVTLKKLDLKSRDRRIHRKRNVAELNVPERQVRLIDVSNARALDGKRLVQKERRIVSQSKSTNAFDKTDKIIRDDISRLSLKNEKTQEMEVSRSKILRRNTNNIKEDSLREKRSIESRLTSSLHLFRKNRERRHVIRIKQRPDPISTRDETERDTKYQHDLNTFSANIHDERQKVNQLRETAKILRENIGQNSLQDSSTKLCTELDQKPQNIKTANTRFRSTNENNRHCSSRNLFIEERVTEFHNARNIRNNRLAKSQRSTILLELNAKPHTQQDRFQLLSNRGRVTNEIHRSTNTREERLQNIKHETHLSRETRHSMSKLSKIQKTRENVEKTRRDRSRSLGTEKKALHEIQHNRNAREESTSNEIQRNLNRQNTQTERLLNTGNVRALARDGQHLMRKIHADERYRDNTDLFEGILTRQRESSLTREQQSMHKLHSTRSTSENNNMRRTRYRSLPNEERVERKHKIIRNTKDERINTRRGTLLSSERQYSISKPATIKLVENTGNSHRDSYRRSSTGDRVINEIQNIREENVRNTRPLLNKVRQPSSHNLYVNIRSTENTPQIRQDRSQSLSTGDKTANEIQRARNTLEESRIIKFNRLLITRRLMSKQNVNKRINDDNTEEISQERSQSLTTRERLTNDIRQTKNARTTNEIRYTRKALEERTTNAIRRAKNVRNDRTTNEFVHSRNTQERQSSLQEVTPLNRDSRHSTIKRQVNKISMDDIRRQKSQSLPIGKREINKVKNSMNARDERATYETRRTSNIREVRANKEIRYTRNTRKENGANEIQRIRNTHNERAANIIQRTRNILEERLSDKRRVVVSTENRQHLIGINKRTTDTDEIHKNRRRSVPTEIDHEFQITSNNFQKRNTQGAPMFREGTRSLLQFSARLIPISNSEIENTFELKWQNLFYILQGIYLCSLFINNPKDNGELKKTRATGWFSMMNYLKTN